MKEITIDCAAIQNPRQLHRELAAALSFPEWYGNNLDALHDCLTEIGEDTLLTLIRFGSMGSFANGFRRVLQDCEETNPHLQIFFK